jgi:DNA-binding winged helix-turn-helix (wHTH) protein
MSSEVTQAFRFGRFELDARAGTLQQDGVRRRLQAQPLKLLVLLVRHAGTLVSYDDIRAELWGQDTFVEFDQAVHFAIRQIREALGDSADRPLYIETVPRRGYRFIAPVAPGSPPVVATAPPIQRGDTTVTLQKALWANITDLRLAEVRRRRERIVLLSLLLVTLTLLAGAGLYIYLRR